MSNIISSIPDTSESQVENGQSQGQAVKTTDLFSKNIQEGRFQSVQNFSEHDVEGF